MTGFSSFSYLNYTSQSTIEHMWCIPVESLPIIRHKSTSSTYKPVLLAHIMFTRGRWGGFIAPSTHSLPIANYVIDDRFLEVRSSHFTAVYKPHLKTRASVVVVVLDEVTNLLIQGCRWWCELMFQWSSTSRHVPVYWFSPNRVEVFAYDAVFEEHRQRFKIERRGRVFVIKTCWPVASETLLKSKPFVWLCYELRRIRNTGAL